MVTGGRISRCDSRLAYDLSVGGVFGVGVGGPVREGNGGFHYDGVRNKKCTSLLSPEEVKKKRERLLELRGEED